MYSSTAAIRYSCIYYNLLLSTIKYYSSTRNLVLATARTGRRKFGSQIHDLIIARAHNISRR